MRDRHLRLNDDTPCMPIQPVIPDKLSESVELVQAGQNIRAIYFGLYRMYSGNQNMGSTHIPSLDGGYSARSSRNYSKAIWPSIAQKLLEVGCNPFAFIKVQFDKATPGRWPYATYLKSAAAMANWRQYSEQHFAELRMKLVSEFNVLKSDYLLIGAASNLNTEQAVHYALNAAATKVTPLVKYIFVSERGLDPKAFGLTRDAAQQYAFESKKYDELLNGRIPATLRSEATALKNLIKGA